MVDRKVNNTSPYAPLRGTTSPPTPLQKRGEKCPPLEGVGGGKNGFVISSNKTIQRQNKQHLHAIQVTLHFGGGRGRFKNPRFHIYPPSEGAGGGPKFNYSIIQNS
jgi:hypothetical protein